MKYGKTIEAARTVAGLSKRRLARIIDVTPSYITHLENDVRRPSLAVLESVAKATRQRLSSLIQVAEENQ